MDWGASRMQSSWSAYIGSIAEALQITSELVSRVFAVTTAWIKVLLTVWLGMCIEYNRLGWHRVCIKMDAITHLHVLIIFGIPQTGDSGRGSKPREANPGATLHRLFSLPRTFGETTFCDKQPTQTSPDTRPCDDDDRTLLSLSILQPRHTSPPSYYRTRWRNQQRPTTLSSSN
jgi:hypothetical protein